MMGNRERKRGGREVCFKSVVLRASMVFPVYTTSAHIPLGKTDGHTQLQGFGL